MWKSHLEDRPIIIAAKDWKVEEFAIICKAFGLEESVQSIIIRENCVIEYQKGELLDYGE